MPVIAADTYDGLVTDSHDFGLEVETFPLAAAAGTQLLAAGGSVYGTALFVRRTFTAANLAVDVTTAGATLTASSSWALLFNAAGTLLGKSADQSGVWTTAGYYSTALTAQATGALTLTPGLYWGAVVSTGTTLPTFAKSGAPQALYNAGYAVALSRCGVLATGITTAPANITPANITQATAQPIWFGLT